MMEPLLFTFSEVIALVGVFQCVYILVYIGFRVRNIARLLLPFLYFFMLGTAFFIDLAQGFIGEFTDYYDVIRWASWTFITPLSVLLIIQMSHITKLPSALQWSILVVMPLAFLFSVFLMRYTQDSCFVDVMCPAFLEWLRITGFITSAISLLAIWGQRNLFSDILNQKAGRERYWLILSLIIMNILFLVLMGIQTNIVALELDIFLLRAVLGLSFVYLVSTSLFRIYPNALLSPQKKTMRDVLTQKDMAILEKIESLLTLDKIYHEATYSRSDLAQELSIAEGYASRLINLHFKKSFPQLLSEYRVEDSKRLLLETTESIQVIARETGFNSLPSFNRVFKDIVGQTPSMYRKNMIK